MSTYYVIEGKGDYFVQDGSPVHYVSRASGIQELGLDTRDALSAPDVESILPSGLALWPRGAAWGSPDGMAISSDSTLANFTRALMGVFADLYSRLWNITYETRSATLVDSLADWERDHGLPEPCTVNEQTIEDRRRFLRAKVATNGYVSPEDFVRLADFHGYSIAIEEPDAFRVGETECGSSDEISNVALEQQWVIHVRDIPYELFEAGVGEAGVTRLLDYDGGPLECVIQRVAPAWTYPFFNYDGWPTSVLTTEGQVNILTEDGEDLIV